MSLAETVLQVCDRKEGLDFLCWSGQLRISALGLQVVSAGKGACSVNLTTQVRSLGATRNGKHEPP